MIRRVIALALAGLLCGQSAFAAIVNVSSASTNGASDFNGCSGCANQDTTGADFLLACVPYFSGGGSTSLSDSKGNSWTLLADIASDGNPSLRVYYSIPTSVGSGHTFTYAAGFTLASIAVASFSGVAQSSPQDGSTTSNSDTSGASSLQPGSITPAANNELWTTCLGAGSLNSAPAVDSPFTYTAVQNQSGSFGVGIGWDIQTTATARNPSWSWSFSPGAHTATTGQVFKAAGGGATIPPCNSGLFLLGVGCGH